jgi:hypothetical protein
MGTKFANLHIKTTNQEIIFNALQSLSNKAGSVLADADYSAMSIIDQYVYRVSKDEEINKKASTVTFYLNKDMSWTSVLNDHFSWGTVEGIGGLLSQFILEPVMTIGFFDEDIFEFTLFQKGEIKTKKYFCEEGVIEENGLESEIIDLNYLKEIFDLNHFEITKLLEISNPERAIDELSRMIQKNLWIHSELISDVKEIEDTYTKLELKIL